MEAGRIEGAEADANIGAVGGLRRVPPRHHVPRLPQDIMKGESDKEEDEGVEVKVEEEDDLLQNGPSTSSSSAAPTPIRQSGASSGRKRRHTSRVHFPLRLAPKST